MNNNFEKFPFPSEKGEVKEEKEREREGGGREAEWSCHKKERKDLTGLVRIQMAGSL
jgi:hypothetical protein